MELTKTKYQQTEVGLIPEDWNIKTIGEIAQVKGGGTPSTRINKYWNGTINWFTPTEIGQSKYVLKSKRKITFDGLNNSSAQLLPIGTILLTSRAGIGDLAILKEESSTNQGFQSLIANKDQDNEFLYYLMLTSEDKLLEKASGSTFLEISPNNVKSIQLLIPPLPEQKAIAEVLSDVDQLIQVTEQKLAKKRAIKQGAMQKLLTPKEDWEVKKLGEVCDVLDHLRVPLNSEQRSKMQGDIPYCGANGVVDYINDYVIDDKIILIAEDGGYFDEYKTRPIAYLMEGKCWVNNHAHILKAKSQYYQNFIFYSIVHKNILDFIKGGTRAKLNKGDLVSIEINMPKLKEKQKHIATILSDLDKEIELIEQQIAKYKTLKQGLMQELLTGKTRLTV